jgi:hypothetical protein
MEDEIMKEDEKALLTNTTFTPETGRAGDVCSPCPVTFDPCRRRPR